MTTIEFSNEFDILYNNIMSNKAPGLNDYEKSVLLTQSQESLILDIYNGQFNEDSFENTEEVKTYISNLVKQVTLSSSSIGDGISKDSKFYQLPNDLWFITYESVILEDLKLGCKSGLEVLVKPVTQDKYFMLNKNPFRKSNERRVLRLTVDSKAELISPYNIKSYLVRYISKPEPIILEDLTDYGITIEGKTQITECKLNPVIHRTILNRAVILAKNIWNTGS